MTYKEFFDAMLDRAESSQTIRQCFVQDRDLSESIMQKYYSGWNEGHRMSEPLNFSSLFASLPALSDDDSSELDAYAYTIKSELAGKIKTAFISALTREQVVTLCNVLYPNEFACIHLVSGVDISVQTLYRVWNDAHPDQATIYPPDPDI